MDKRYRTRSSVYCTRDERSSSVCHFLCLFVDVWLRSISTCVRHPQMRNVPHIRTHTLVRTYTGPPVLSEETLPSGIQFGIFYWPSNSLFTPSRLTLFPYYGCFWGPVKTLYTNFKFTCRYRISVPLDLSTQLTLYLTFISNPGSTCPGKNGTIPRTSKERRLRSPPSTPHVLPTPVLQRPPGLPLPNLRESEN